MVLTVPVQGRVRRVPGRPGLLQRRPQDGDQPTQAGGNKGTERFIYYRKPILHLRMFHVRLSR